MQCTTICATTAEPSPWLQSVFTVLPLQCCVGTTAFGYCNTRTNLSSLPLSPVVMLSHDYLDGIACRSRLWSMIRLQTGYAFIQTPLQHAGDALAGVPSILDRPSVMHCQASCVYCAAPVLEVEV